MDTTATCSTDADLFRVLKAELFTAVVGDILDTLGHRRQFLPAGIKPLRDDMKIAGRAMPVLEADVFSDGKGSFGPLAGRCYLHFRGNR